MSVSIEDLQPKPFKINLQGVELESKPLRLSHALTLNKLAEIFKSPNDSTKDQIKSAEKDLDEVIGELIPELQGKLLGLNMTIELLTQMMESIQPSDNKELAQNGVELNANDPKVEKTG